MATIARVESWVESAPLDVGDPAFGITSSFTVLVRVTNDEGRAGFGYTWQFREGYARAVVAILDEMTADVVGRRAEELGDIWHSLETDHLDFLGASGTGRLAQGALDMALWDLRGKELGSTLTQMVGEVRTTCPVYCGLTGRGDLDSLQMRATRAAEAGFAAVKMGASSPDVGSDRERVAAVREAIGPGVGLLVDSFRRLDLESAIRTGRMLEDFDVMWWEDPVAKDDLDGLRRVSAEVDVPLALGEDVYAISEFRQLIATGCVRFLLVDLQRVGGITGWYAVSKLAAEHGVSVAPHMFTHIARHLVATTPNAVIAEYQWFWDDLFGPVVSGGRLIPATDPGIGLTPRFGGA